MSRRRHKLHPAEKPVEVLQRCVQLITPGLPILDPFMGSGSTLVACVLEGRPCIGIELDDHYFQIACSRVEAALQEREAQGRQGQLFAAD
jgi:DNA modification methylase